MHHEAVTAHLAATASRAQIDAAPDAADGRTCAIRGPNAGTATDFGIRKRVFSPTDRNWPKTPVQPSPTFPSPYAQRVTTAVHSLDNMAPQKQGDAAHGCRALLPAGAANCQKQGEQLQPIGR
jgi:hypothetical protein